MKTPMVPCIPLQRSTSCPPTTRFVLLILVGTSWVKKCDWKPTESQRLLKVFVYPKQKCSFAGAGSVQAGIVAVMFGHDVLKKVLRLYVLSITSKGETSVLDTEECPISDPEVCCKLLNRYHPSIKHYPYIACR